MKNYTTELQADWQPSNDNLLLNIFEYHPRYKEVLNICESDIFRPRNAFDYSICQALYECGYVERRMFHYKQGSQIRGGYSEFRKRIYTEGK